MRRAVAITVLLAAALVAAHARADEILLSDDFEAYLPGTPLTSGVGGWSALYNSVNDPANNIFTDQVSSDGRMSLQQYGAHSGCWASGASHAVVLPTEFMMDVDMMASGEMDISYPNVCADDRQDIVAGLYSDFAPWGHGAWLLAFVPNHVLWTPLANLTDNAAYMRWYNFKMKINRIEGRVDYWVDGVYMGQQQNPYLLTWGPTLQHVYFQSGCGKGWIDKVRVYTDNTAPVSTVSLAGTAGENNIYWSDVSVALAADDGPSGSGVDKTEYSFDAGGTWTPYAGPFTVSAEGTTVIDYRSVDRAGNVELFKVEDVTIDRIAPVVTDTNPINGATAVPAGQAIAVTFSENIQPGADYANARLYKARIDPSKEAAVTRSVVGNVLNIAPNQPLLPGTIYRVVIPQGAVKDLAGHPLATNFPPYSFTTAP